MKRSIPKQLTALFAMLLVVCMLVSAMVGCTPANATTDLAVASPTYPETVKAPGTDASEEDYDAWSDYNMDRLAASEGNTAAMKAFYQKTLAEVLGNSKAAGNSDTNALYSPLNVYLALAMLTETTDGNSRQQLLDLLGEKSITSLRKRVGTLFTANYQDDGSCTSLLANSLWMNEDVSYKQETIDTLAKDHYAYAFAGQPGTTEMDEALRAWVNENTKDLLKEQAEELSLDASTVLALVSTIYYKAAWEETFNSDLTKQQTFHVPSGDQKVDMMHTVATFPYYSGKNFTAIAMPMNNSGSMWVFLPKGDATPAELASDEEVLDLLTDSDSMNNASYPEVTLSFPKMDVVSDTDLMEDLRKLGVTDIFNAAKADFSPLMEDASNLAVTDIKHAARVKANEDGVEAAAFTAILINKTSLPPEQVEFTVDRPFFFALTGYTGDLLFTGVVNNPAG